jgi:hypothetical protein
MTLFLFCGFCCSCLFEGSLAYYCMWNTDCSNTDSSLKTYCCVSNTCAYTVDLCKPTVCTKSKECYLHKQSLACCKNANCYYDLGSCSGFTSCASDTDCFTSGADYSCCKSGVCYYTHDLCATTVDPCENNPSCSPSQSTNTTGNPVPASGVCPQAEYLLRNYCYQSCPGNTWGDDVSGTCIECPMSNCIKCINRFTCGNCSANYVIMSQSEYSKRVASGEINLQNMSAEARSEYEKNLNVTYQTVCVGKSDNPGNIRLDSKADYHTLGFMIFISCVGMIILAPTRRKEHVN